MRRENVEPTDVHPAIGYAHAVRVGDVLYISGQVPREPDGTIVDPTDLEGQIRRVFTNLLRVLEAAGGDPGDLVKVTTFLTHREQFEVWRRVRGEMLQPPYPASTLVVVDSLSYPEYLIEIEAIAGLGTGADRLQASEI
jgi:enamine deaminase RidA (YjgF/YER057c/UK114 family)